MSKNKYKLSYCADQLRQQDKDRYLSCLLAPETYQEALFSVYAFNAEISKTRDVVTEPLLGQIRLQWWRENIEKKITGEGIDHPILTPLAEASKHFNLSVDIYDRLLTAREQDLEEEPFATIDALLLLQEQQNAPLFEIEALCLTQAPLTENMKQASRLAGRIWGMLTQLQNYPKSSAQRRLVFPLDLVSKYGLDLEKKIYPLQDKSLAQIVEHLCLEIEKDYSNLKRLRGVLSKPERKSLRLLGLAPAYLRVLRKANYDLFAPHVQMEYPFKTLILAAKSFCNLY